MIKAIIFDCFGVLTTDLLMEFTTQLPPEIMPSVHELIHQRSSGTLTRANFVKQLAEITKHKQEDIAVVTKPGGVKNVELLKYIRSLISKKYKIGLLSNIGSDWIREEFLTKEEQELFDDILLSYEVGLIKPDAKIYQLAAERLGVGIKECILVDDIAKYCEAAKQEGMKAIVYQNFDQMKTELEKLLDPTD